MKRILLVIFLGISILCVNAQTDGNDAFVRVDTCTPDLGTGDGKDGAGNPLSNILGGYFTIDANGNFTSTGNVLLLVSNTGQNVLNFHDFNLGAGHIFSVSEPVPQGALIIKC